MKGVNRVLFALVVVSVQLAFGQSMKSGLGQETLEGLKGEAASTGLSIAQPVGLALESIIDPALYFVGPSDVFSVNIWISPPLHFLLTVTPEGTLIIPTVGEVRISELTLKDAKQRIVAEIKKKYVFGGATATLATPRPIVVHLTGHVLNPGSYVVASHNRANKAIEDANTPRTIDQGPDAQYYVSTMSTRNISVRHNDGSVTRVDVPKFLATKENRWNPYLQGGDVIVVPRSNRGRNVIGVYGEVNVPGQFEFVKGDSLKDALLVTYGLTQYALADSVEFSRFNDTDDGISSTTINLAAILRGEQPDFALRPGDRIVVHAHADQRGDFIVSIDGEVMYPGSYPISKRSTHLSEIIRRAGGFTEYASLKDASLSRHSVGKDQVQLEHLESLHGGVPSEDTSYYYLETNLRLQKEIVNTDLHLLYEAKDSTQDVILLPGDNIQIPSIRKTVYLFGQIVTPGHIPYVAGQGLAYYIGRAGGYTDRAREGDVKIVKAKTRQWLSPNATRIEEGDYVWVPKETERPFSYYMSIIGETASIISVGVSIILLVIQTQK